MFKEALLSIVSAWSLDQIDVYIQELETRILETEELVKELKRLRKKKGRKNYETGARDGR